MDLKMVSLPCPSLSSFAIKEVLRVGSDFVWYDVCACTPPYLALCVCVRCLNLDLHASAANNLLPESSSQPPLGGDGTFVQEGERRRLRAGDVTDPLAPR